MDTRWLPQKRSRSFNVVEFGETVCKRLRGARLSLLARVDSGEGADVSRCARKVLSPLVARRSEHTRSLPTLASPSAPGELHAGLLRPLPPATVRGSAPDPIGGSSELWDVSRPSDAPQSSGGEPLSYLDYLSWLQRVLPKSMQPISTELVEQGEGEEDNEGHEHLSALDLLRRLTVVAEPESPCRRKIAPLTSEERELAESGLEPGDGGENLVSRFNVELTRKQLACLMPGQWLNDEVINFYCKLLEERGKKSSDAPKCWFPNSFFWPKLSGANNSSYSYKDVRRWTVKAKIDIFQLDYVLFPMNIGESHWALGAIDLRAKGFRYFDSMFCRPHKNFVPFLQQYLQDEHKAKKGAPLEGAEAWELIIPDEPLPQQNNGYDCGVFTCCFAEYFSSGRDLIFDQEDMPDLRLRVAARIMRGDEDWDA